MSDAWARENPQLAQVAQAVEYLATAKERAIVPPFRNLFHLTKHLTSPSIWFFVAFSGHGKTTLAMAMAEEWGKQGVPVWFLGLETQPDELRLKRAAKACDIHPGLAMSGQLTDEEYQRVQDHLMEQAQHIAHGGSLANLTFSPTTAINVAELQMNAAEAYERGNKVFIIDHIDHISGDGSGMDDSRRVMYALHAVSKQYPMIYIAMSQANMESVRGDVLGCHGPVQPHHVWMPSVKRSIATGMVGIYRPLVEYPKDPEAQERYRQDMTDVRKKLLDPWKMVALNTMSLNVMKHRDYGEMEGQKGKLYVERGNVRDWTSMDDITRGYR